MDDGEPVNKPYRARGVSFVLAQKLPSPSNIAMKKMKWSKAEKDTYEAIYNAALVCERHQLMGYRDMSYDGEQPATDTLLFQCFSDSKTGMAWGDDDDLFFYVPKKALAKGDFSKVTSCCGE